MNLKRCYGTVTILPFKNTSRNTKRKNFVIKEEWQITCSLLHIVQARIRWGLQNLFLVLSSSSTIKLLVPVQYSQYMWYLHICHMRRERHTYKWEPKYVPESAWFINTRLMSIISKELGISLSKKPWADWLHNILPQALEEEKQHRQKQQEGVEKSSIFLHGDLQIKASDLQTWKRVL